MASVSDNEAFTKEILSGYPLDDAIEWVKHNMTPGEVFSDDQLSEWAVDNGFTEPGE